MSHEFGEVPWPTPDYKTAYQTIVGFPPDPAPLSDERVISLPILAGAFVPRGLLVWNPARDARVMSLKSGVEEAFPLAIEGIPATLFSEGRSFEELEELAAEGQLDSEISEHQKFRGHIIEEGQLLALRIRGGFESAAAWGYGIR